MGGPTRSVECNLMCGGCMTCWETSGNGARISMTLPSTVRIERSGAAAGRIPHAAVWQRTVGAVIRPLQSMILASESLDLLKKTACGLGHAS